MADPLSITASVLGVAGAGTRLATTLYTYAESAFRADKNLKSIAQDVSLTSAVINELGIVLKHEGGPKICSDNAVQTAEQTINSCKNVFDEINAALKQSLKAKVPSKPRISAIGRLIWPLKEQRMELIRSNLEKLKSTLMLMLHVLQYARSIVKEEPSAEALEQRKQIETLAQVQQDNTRKYEALLKASDSVGFKDSASTKGTTPGSGCGGHPSKSSQNFPGFFVDPNSNSQPPLGLRFEEIIEDLEHAIGSIEAAILGTRYRSYSAAAGVDPRSPYSSDFRAVFVNLDRGLDCSQQAKRALQEQHIGGTISTAWPVRRAPPVPNRKRVSQRSWAPAYSSSQKRIGEHKQTLESMDVEGKPVITTGTDCQCGATMQPGLDQNQDSLSARPTVGSTLADILGNTIHHPPPEAIDDGDSQDTSMQQKSASMANEDGKASAAAASRPAGNTRLVQHHLEDHLAEFAYGRPPSYPVDGGYPTTLHSLDVEGTASYAGGGYPTTLGSMDVETNGSSVDFTTGTDRQRDAHASNVVDELIRRWTTVEL